MSSSERSAETSRQAGIWFIFVTILLDAIGIGLLIPVLPDVLRRFVSDPNAVADAYGWFIMTYALMQFVASPVLGTLSDRFGRKPVLLISLLGAGLDYLFMAFAPTLPLLFIGRVISGLTGASMTVASSYMADISDDSNRSANFGMIGAAWGLGFITGPLIGGVLGSLGAAAPFLAAAGLNLANFLFGVFVLPESLPAAMRRKISLKAFNPLTSIIKILRPSAFVGLVWIYFLLFIAGNVHPVNWTLYTEMRFGWSAWDVGMSLSFVGLVFAAVQGGLTRLVVPKLGEERVLTIGLVVYTLAYLAYGLAPYGWMMYAITLLAAFSGLAMPALQSVLARHVPANEQGELQGSLMALGSLAAIIAPLLFTRLFVEFTKKDTLFYVPGAAYFGAALIALLTFGLWMAVRRRAMHKLAG